MKILIALVALAASTFAGIRAFQFQTGTTFTREVQPELTDVEGLKGAASMELCVRWVRRTGVALENRDSSPATIEADFLGGGFTVSVAGSNIFAVGYKRRGGDFPLAAFDGVVDQAGPSGVSWHFPNQGGFDRVIVDDPVLMAAILAGAPLQFAGFNNFTASGPGNLKIQTHDLLEVQGMVGVERRLVP